MQQGVGLRVASPLFETLVQTADTLVHHYLLWGEFAESLLWNRALLTVSLMFSAPCTESKIGSMRLEAAKDQGGSILHIDTPLGLNCFAMLGQIQASFC